MYKKIILGALTSFLVGCTTPPSKQVGTFPVAKQKVKEKSISSVYIDNRNPSNCLYRDRKSLTCLTRDAQIKLERLNLNLDNIYLGIGDCAGCAR